MNSVLVTGGAGYIGSHMVQALRRAGYRTVILDNLSEGHEAALRGEAFVEGDLGDRGTVRAVLRRHRPQAIMHFAASCSVAESVSNPLKYYQNNVAGTMNLLQTALEVGVSRFIFSSTAAVYGELQETPITEMHPLNPINSYGWSKLMGERILAEAATAYGIRFVVFRYFNAAGAEAASDLGEDHRPENHLIPLAIRAALQRDQELSVFGTDYPTRDGSCIRDYIHVSDLADAHLLGLKYLEGEGESTVFNLGTESGTSVLEVIQSIQEITNLEVPHRIAERRPGDPAILVASNQRARSILGWEPKRNFDEIVRSAYDFMQEYPKGYPAGPRAGLDLSASSPDGRSLSTG